MMNNDICIGCGLNCDDEQTCNAFKLLEKERDEKSEITKKLDEVEIEIKIWMEKFALDEMRVKHLEDRMKKLYNSLDISISIERKLRKLLSEKNGME